jgi:multidrug efflux system outer membrane protein
LVLLAGACATRGRPALEPLPVSSLRSAPGGVGDTLRTFFDSLRTANQPAAQLSSVMLAGDTAQAVAWVNLLQDPVLLGLVREAIDNNRDLKVARARIQEFRAQVGVEHGPLLPELSANGSASTQQTVFGGLGTFGFDAWRVTADLSWELDFWGRIRGNVAGAEADLAARREDVRATVLSLVGDVATAYLNLAALDQNVAIAERTLTSRRATLKLAERRLSEGLISELDVRQFEAQVAAPAARVAEFRLAIARTEHQLSQLLGRGPGPIPRGRPLVEVAREVTVPDSVSSLLIARRPDVLRAEHEVAAAAARTGAQRAARLPSVIITGQYGSQADSPGDLFKGSTEIYTAMAGISVPLFDGGRRLNDQRAASAREEQAVYRHEQVVLTALREVSDALVAVRSTRDQLAAQRVQLGALRRALELAERRYDSGISSYLEVLDAQRSLFEAELATTGVEQAYLSSAVQLYRALGGSWQADDS